MGVLKSAETRATDDGHGAGDLVAEIAACRDLESACFGLASHLADKNIVLLSVKFCDIDDKKPALRPFGKYPCAISNLSTQLRDIGGCPITKEAITTLRPFDAVQIDDRKYPDFLSRRFLDEIRKVGHSHVAVVPVILGQGLMLITAGLGDSEFEGELREQVIMTVCSFGIATVQRFGDVANLFRSKILSQTETQALLLLSSGSSTDKVAKLIGLSETTTRLILGNAARKLRASSLAEATAKALAIGEINNTHTLHC